MSTITAPLATTTSPTPPTRIAVPTHGRSAPPSRFAEWVADTAVMTWRNLLHVRREPMQLSDATIQPVLFTLLFVYVFGGAMIIPGGTYKDFAIAGLLTLNLTTGSIGTAVGLSTDLETGVIDRFRTLPLARSSVLVGRSFSDLLTAVLATAFVLGTGLAIGWRTDAAALSVVAGIGVALLFAYAMSWFSACVGLVSQGAEAAEGLGFVILFPVAFVSNAFVPTQGMPAWLATVANWNPVSAVAAAIRELFGNPNPSSTIDAWPMQHPVAAAVGWSILILGLCVPTATRLYRKRTVD